MPKQYYKFTETNWGTTDKTEYYIPLTEKQWRSLATQINCNPTYVLAAQDKWLSEREVDDIIRSHMRSTSAIKNVYKCEPPLRIPRADDFADFDPFYEGGCWKIVRPKDEELT